MYIAHGVLGPGWDMTGDGWPGDTEMDDVEIVGGQRNYGGQRRVMRKGDEESRNRGKNT